MALRVHVVCQNFQDDRVIPRMARALRDGLGWTLGADISGRPEFVYLSGYFEAQRVRRLDGVPMAAYFTHREEEPPNNAKGVLFDRVARDIDLRIATCKIYADMLAKVGPTAQVSPPLERDHFRIVGRKRGPMPVVGFAGYTYPNHRKGEDLVKGILAWKLASKIDWRASGRGWPVKTQRSTWAQMPRFYQALDVLVVPSRVEGVPMPPLEALACGVKIVVPRGVGLLDEIPDTPGIYRYERGDLKALLAALEQAAFGPEVDREALREATAAYSIENWVRDNAAAVYGYLEEGQAHDRAGIDPRPVSAKEVDVTFSSPAQRGTGKTRGIYCVAFGDPARKSALKMMQTAKRHMPDIPIALCAAKKIGPENLLLLQPDSDVGGRRAKLQAYELAPAEWEAVLYLDVDIEITAPVYRFFEWIEDGWEFVITKDPHLMDTMHSFERKNNKAELAKIQAAVKTLHTLQINGGVWAFARNARVAAFFQRWRTEWEVYAQRDQGALVRALYADPLKVFWLGNEWNTFPRYMPTENSAGILHYPGRARRWKGMIPGRIDGAAAWAMVKEFEQREKAAK